MKKDTTQVSRSNLVDGNSSRPPIVVVLGHVDHGKTTLLDKIRSSNVAAREAGGITQHIGAYQVEVTTKEGPRKITFIDTPGHAAFAEMRSRGARVADIAVLVVSGEEGVKPQTIESLKFIQEAKIAYLVAVTKIDLSNVDLAKVKNELVRAGVPLEGFGGDVVVVPLSAKTGKGMDDLLEMILLTAEMAELKGDTRAPLEAVVIESKLDSNSGPLATVVVRNGSLKLGSDIFAGGTSGRIRAMLNEFQKPVKEALPGQAVEILGFKQAPAVGEKLSLGQSAATGPIVCPVDLNHLDEAEAKQLRVILKADTLGTLEAISKILSSEILILKAEPGNINESDINQAAACAAQIVGFNVKAGGSVKKLAETEKVRILHFSTIYQLAEALQKSAYDLLNPEPVEEELGHAEIIAEFLIDKKEKIAGAKVKDGQITKANPIHLLRGDKIIATGRVKSLKKGKIESEKAITGEEFGIGFFGEFDFTIGDMLSSFRKIK
jgi:translation initiation factor IF-2